MMMDSNFLRDWLLEKYSEGVEITDWTLLSFFLLDFALESNSADDREWNWIDWYLSEHKSKINGVIETLRFWVVHA